jgi:hypothetical protein
MQMLRMAKTFCATSSIVSPETSLQAENTSYNLRSGHNYQPRECLLLFYWWYERVWDEEHRILLTLTDLSLAIQRARPGNCQQCRRASCPFRHLQLFSGQCW